MAVIEVENEAKIDFDEELYQSFIDNEHFPDGIILLVLRNKPISGFNSEIHGVTISKESYFANSTISTSQFTIHTSQFIY